MWKSVVWLPRSIVLAKNGFRLQPCKCLASSSLHGLIIRAVTIRFEVDRLLLQGSQWKIQGAPILSRSDSPWWKWLLYDCTKRWWCGRYKTDGWWRGIIFQVWVESWVWWKSTIDFQRRKRRFWGGKVETISRYATLQEEWCRQEGKKITGTFEWEEKARIFESCQ